MSKFVSVPSTGIKKGESSNNAHKKHKKARYLVAVVLIAHNCTTTPPKIQIVDKAITRTTNKVIGVKVSGNSIGKFLRFLV